MKLLILSLMLLCLNLQADDYLIQEIEDLNNSLSYDDPAKTQLILRLADLYFDSSIKESDDSKTQEKRRRSLELYEQVFYGHNDISKVTGRTAIKVQFQIARMYMKIQKKVKAIQHFKDVYKLTNDKNLKREASFELADIYEKKGNFELANNYYKNAISLCLNIDSCNYAHYRRAWLLYKETRLNEAINELKLSLWDSRGQVREKVLNDYIMFLSNKQTSGIEELKEFEKLAKKINNHQIIRTLAESFFSNGNRVAGTHIFEYLNVQNPSSYLEVRLLEEYYGNSDHNKIKSILAKLSKRSAKDLSKKNEHKLEIIKILRRVIVQLDADNQNNKFSNELLSSIDIYLNFFPEDELRQKMQEGWLDAQVNMEKKLVRLKTWIDQSIKLNHSNEIVLKFRLSRLSIAQKLKKSQDVIQEALEIAKIKNVKEAREFLYIAARQMYETKEYDKALTIFLKLSNSSLVDSNFDKWAILSQNLILDIYNTKKDYISLMDQASKWISLDKTKLDKKTLVEVKQMKLIYNQAKFEYSASLGDSPKALVSFYDFCINNIFKEKSCKNAKVLAVKIKDQNKLVSLLELENDEKSLMIEYELMGRFTDAAKIQEKLYFKSADIKKLLKIALLYELGLDFKKRDYVLKRLIKKLKSIKSFDKDLEKLVFVTLDEANLLDQKSLSIKWSLPYKLKLAHRIQASNNNKQAKQILLAQSKSVGPEWSKLIVSKIMDLDEKQRKISFYGRNSKRRFQRRVNSLERLSTKIKSYLDGADIETRVYLLNIAKFAYQDLSNKILSTPLPKDLDESTLNNVKDQLSQMAAPFIQMKNDYERIMLEQIKTIDSNDLKNKVITNTSNEDPDYLSFFNTQKVQVAKSAHFDYSKIHKINSELNNNPSSLDTLLDYSKFYKENKSLRIASYFKERISSFNSTEKQ